MPASGSLTKNLIKNASWLFSGGVAAAAFASAEAVVLARFLGIEQFGLFSLIIAYVGIVNGIIDLKSHEAVIRYVGQRWELGDKEKTLSFIKLFYLLDFLVGVVAFLACVVLARTANDIFIQSEEAFGLILIYALSILVTSVNQTSETVLRVFDRFKTIAFIRTFRVGFRVSLVCACMFLGFGIKWVFFSYVVAAFLFFLMLQATVFRTLGQKGLKRWTSAKIGNLRTAIGEIRSFVLTSTFAGFLSNVLSRECPVLLLGHFTGHEAAGFYKVATVFSRVIMRLHDPIVQAVYPPLVAARTRSSLKVFVDIVSYATRNVLKFFLPLGALFFLLANEFVVIFFGTEYQPATSAMRIIIISETLSGFYFWVDGAEMALDRIRQRTVRYVVLSAAYVTALLLLIPQYSYDGAAAAKLVPSVILLAVSFFLFTNLRRRSQFAAREK